MRTRAMLRGDIRFQYKYGFYFLYLVFTLIYIGLLYALPPNWREEAAILMIFSDPAAMGLYFMGAIVLFEKSERALSSIAVSPVKPFEYVLSKLISIAIISTAAALVIGLGGRVKLNPLYFFFGVFAGSCLFSAMGLMIAANIGSLNQFIVATIPVEILINLPAIAWLFGWRPPLMILHPGAAIIELLQSGEYALPAVFIVLTWTAAATFTTRHIVTRSLRSLGGVKL